MHNKKMLLLGAVVLTGASPSSYAELATWNAPALDTWTFLAGNSTGSHTLGPTFVTSPGTDENDQVIPSTGRDPASTPVEFTL
jgi:hypothetical protein